MRSYDNQTIGGVNMENKSKIDHTSLQHGFFQFTFPHTWKAIVAWVIAFMMFLAAGLFLMFSLDIPDVPPVSEAISIDNLDEIDEDEEVDLGQGWDGGTGTFVTMDVVIAVSYTHLRAHETR